MYILKRRFGEFPVSLASVSCASARSGLQEVALLYGKIYCMYVCMYVCLYVCVYACMFVCMYACMLVWMYVK